MNILNADDLENAPCGFLTFSDIGMIESINTTLLKLLGYHQHDELIGKQVEHILTIAGRIFYQTHFYPLIKLQGKANEIFFFLKTNNNDSLPVICNAVRKEVKGIFINHCIFIVVTERGKYEQELLTAKRQAEEALQRNAGLVEAKKELELNSIELDRQVSRLKQVNEYITQFSKIVSHDLQEPIRKIAVLADKLAIELKQLFLDTQSQELEKINRECRRLRHLATYLEKFISLNIKTEEFVKLDLNEVILKAYSKVVTMFKADSPVSFKCEILPMADGYISQLQLMFYNILENCFKFKDPLKPLSIYVESVTVKQNSFRTVKGKYRYIDFVKIMITDNGNGFESIDRQRVFMLLKHKNDTSYNFGFGLAFCKKIADNHYGNIYAESVIGIGTTIVILLPVEQTHI